MQDMLYQFFEFFVKNLDSDEDVAVPPRDLWHLRRRARDDVEEDGVVLDDAQVEMAAVALGRLSHHGLHAVIILGNTTYNMPCNYRSGRQVM